MTYRRRLPTRRHQETFEFEHEGLHYIASVGFYDDRKTAAEVFLNGEKLFSLTDIMAADAAIAVSLALQHGCPFYVLRDAVKRKDNGDPMGPIGKLLDMVYKEHNP